VTAPNGHLELLVINKNANADVDEQFQLTGFGPSGAAAVWQYGEAEDTAQSLTTDGHASLTHFTSALSLSGASFHFTFPRYSMTVLDLAPVAGPYVADQSPAGTVFDTVSHLLLTFNTAIDPATFTTASITSFTRSAGATQTDLSTALLAVTPVPESGGKQFDISFRAQSATGAYRLTFGPDVLDLAGEPMAQEYAATFTIRGPMIVAATPTGNDNLPDPARTARVTFNEPINPATFTPYQVLVRGPSAPVAVTAVTPVAGSNDTQFDIAFPQLATGTYTVLVLPSVQDMAGHPLDQEGNLIGGELPDDIFVLEFGVRGLQVVDSATSINSTVAGMAYRVHLRFNEPVDYFSFTPEAVTITGPDGSHPAFAVLPTPDTNFTQFDVLFVPLTAAGTYRLSVGPHVRDVYGNEMDQDGDLLPGEVSDAYTTTFLIRGGQLAAAAPAGTLTQPVDHVRVTFSLPMAPGSFTLAQVSGFTRTAGADTTDLLPALTGVTVVPFSNDTEFDIAFATQGRAGAYRLTLSPDITDRYGNPLGAPALIDFALAGGPRVSAVSPSGRVGGPVDHVRVAVDRPVDASTFTPAQVSLRGPDGQPVEITAVVEVPGSGRTQFDITFAAQSAAGDYSLTLSPDITDLFGNPLAGAPVEVLRNGGFETGGLDGWAQSGDTGYTDVLTGPADGVTIHSGGHALEIGPTSLGYLTQTLATTAGASYTLTFWLSHPYSVSSNEWLVRVGGATLMDVRDAGNFGYTQFTFTFTATGSSTSLQFGMFDQVGYYYLDDVSVTTGGPLTYGFTITAPPAAPLPSAGGAVGAAPAPHQERRADSSMAAASWRVVSPLDSPRSMLASSSSRSASFKREIWVTVRWERLDFLTVQWWGA
jgi:methionine-rich copper-binding protein CopC